MFARLTKTVPKTEKTLKSLGFQGILVRETGLEASENDKYETIEFGKALFFKGF